MLQNFYKPGERASSEPSIFTFSSASGERVCDLWLINERAKPLARSAHATVSSWPARLARLIGNPGGEEEIDEVEVEEFENLIEVSPMKVGMNAA